MTSMQDLPPLPKCLSEANMSFIESDLSLISRIEDTNIPTVLTRKIDNLPVNDHPDDEEDDMKQISSANNINRLNKINQDKLNRCQANICSDNNNKTNNASESVNDYCESDMKTSANSLITSNFAGGTLNNNTYNKSDYHINNSQSNESNDNSDITLPIKSSDIQLGCTISQVPPALPGSVLDNLIAALRREMFALRQMDLSLVSQLLTLNKSIQEFRALIEERDVDQEEEDEDDDEETNEKENLGDKTYLAQPKTKGEVLDMEKQNYSGQCPSRLSYESMKSTDVDKEVHLNESNTKPKMPLKTTRTSITTQPRSGSQPSLIAANKTSLSDALTPIETTSANVQVTTSNAQVCKTGIEAVKPVPRMRNAPPPPPNIGSVKRQFPPLNKDT